MKTKLKLHLLFLALLGGFAHAQGTAISCQGFLTDQGVPANAVYDLRFAIYADASSGTVTCAPTPAWDHPVEHEPRCS